MKKYLFIFAGVLVVLLIAFFLQSFIRNNLDIFGKKATMTVGEKKIQLDIADDQKKREIGLSDKKSLSNDRGMLFIFDKPDYYNFWMRNMDFPIDIIFLSDNSIVTIHKNVPAPTTDNVQDLKLYPPKEASNRVVELNAGQADALSLKEGQTVDIKE